MESNNELKQLKKQQLIQAYRESAKEARQENQFFEGVGGDGLSGAEKRTRKEGTGTNV